MRQQKALSHTCVGLELSYCDPLYEEKRGWYAGAVYEVRYFRYQIHLLSMINDPIVKSALSKKRLCAKNKDTHQYIKCFHAYPKLAQVCSLVV